MGPFDKKTQWRGCWKDDWVTVCPELSSLGS